MGLGLERIPVESLEDKAAWHTDRHRSLSVLNVVAFPEVRAYKELEEEDHASLGQGMADTCYLPLGWWEQFPRLVSSSSLEVEEEGLLDSSIDERPVSDLVVHSRLLDDTSDTGEVAEDQIRP